MNIKAVIFDLDGVICSTDQYHYLAWKKIADAIHVPFDEYRNNMLRGVSRMKSLEIILQQSDREFTQIEKEHLAEDKNTYYRMLLEEMGPQNVAKETMETLCGLRRSGYLLAVGSSSKNTRLILDKTGMLELFDEVADGTEIENSKPDPEVFLLAANKLHVRPEECMVVEDAVSGIQAAHSANMIAVGIGDAGAMRAGDYNISHLLELHTILELVHRRRVGG